MARIPEADIDQLKRDISLERLVEAKGIKLKRHGQDLVGLCPFHDDKTPSLVISPKKNLWHCLGACQAGGSVIDWVMKAEGVSFRHAVELLREDSPSLAAEQKKRRVGRPPKDGRTVAKYSTARRLDSPVERGADTQAALRQVIDYYHETLKQSPEAMAYLEKRGLKSSEMIERFRLGFCNRTLCYRLPAKNRQAGAELRGALQETGILRQSGHEHFRGSIVIPIFDEQGAVVEVYGRKLNDNLRPGTSFHLYLPGPHRGVFNVEALKASKEIILCESLIDALTFWCAGYRNVTSSYGVEGFTDDHLQAFDRYGTQRVLIAYDRDDAGDKAAEKLAAKLIERGIECFRVQFPKGMDANEYALKVEPAPQSLGVAIRGAVWLGKGKAPAAVVATEPVGAEPLEQTDAPSPLAANVPSPTLEQTPEPETEPPVAASPVPAPPRSEILAEVTDQEVVLRFGDRRWRIRGLAKNLSYDSLRVNVLCGQAESFHVDTFDLYSAKHRAGFITQAAAELGIEERVLKKDLGKVLLKLEQLQDEQIQAALNPTPVLPEMTVEEREEAMALLKSPDLLDRILADFERCGVVGEETNKLAGYLAAVSRKLPEPLAVIIQSSSAAGKSSLMDAILSLMPEEERVQYSAMTGQSLFYMGETDLKHKVLAIVEEEGAERAVYALKLLQSEGVLTIASTGKDPATGRLVTHEYRVEGPVMIFLTTTAVELDEELLNRCLVLTVDEDREQTQAIHRRQRKAETLDGFIADEDRSHITKLHRNAQRLLEPLRVVNPFAEQLTFLDDRTRTRRDHKKYLALIRSIALLRQHQRPRKTTTHRGRQLVYIEATLDDIAVANRLACEVLGRSLDELPPQTRRLLVELERMVAEACSKQQIDRSDYRFTRRDVREHTGWSLTQVRVHLDRLVELEYVAAYRGRPGQRFAYQLTCSPDGPSEIGLVDVEALKMGMMPTWRGVAGGWHEGAARSKSALPKVNSETWRGGGQSTSRAKIPAPSYVAVSGAE